MNLPVIVAQLQETKAAMNRTLLEVALQGAKLPAAAESLVRAQFEGKSFEAADVTKSIDSARKLVSELTGKDVAQGPGRIHGMLSSEDQLTAAVEDLFEVPRSAGLEVCEGCETAGHPRAVPGSDR